MEKRPAVSTDRLTTSSPKRDFWIESVSDISGEVAAVDSFTDTPDQQLVTNDQEVAKKRTKTKEVLLPDLRLKVIIVSSIEVIVCAIYLIFIHDFSVWE
jgi:hypothetical protein